MEVESLWAQSTYSNVTTWCNECCLSGQIISPAMVRENIRGLMLMKIYGQMQEFDVTNYLVFDSKLYSNDFRFP